jgi:hypothetical protein
MGSMVGNEPALDDIALLVFRRQPSGARELSGARQP